MKIETAINNGSIELKKNAIKSSRLDSEILLSKVLNKDRKFIILNSEGIIKNDNYECFKNLIKERTKGKPIAYMIGKKYFWKYEFEVSKNVLIPRPDTEIIIENILDVFRHKKELSFLDVGTGSGCILLSILKEKKKLFRYRNRFK